ncbi:MAG: hypothetical protein JST87_13320 [Bacteroidetes bacterium]|nr:hypothetical protein [Bacteroidota bacterium]
MKNKHFALLTLCFYISVFCIAQVKSLSSLPAYDCNLKKLLPILGKPTIILSPDDNKMLKPVIDEYCGDFGNNCISKTTSQMVDSDYSKQVFIVGDIRKIENWQKFKLPVKQLPNGFEINNIKFTDSSDGFTFIDSTHIIVSGNSLKAIKDVQLAFSGGYDITILQKGKITYFGNYVDKKFDWYNLQNLKQANYVQKQSASFQHIYISKTFPDTIDFLHTETELQKYINQFLSIYKIKRPVKKIDWFIHTNMQEYGVMSGMFGFMCPGNNSAGFSIRGEIHTHGYGIGLVKHEYSHYLFDNAIPQDHNPAFFVEGCVEYVTDLNDETEYKQRVNIAKQYKDTLDYEGLIIKNNDFYGKYSGTNYSVCGVFVKYLIDNFGVEKFKKYCLAEDKLEAARTIYSTDFTSIVAGYRNWLDKQ